MNISELNEMLCSDALSVVRDLLPNGKRDGGEWCVGSIHGEAGKSLKVRVSGSKVGVWHDFAAGHGGDLVDLWRDSKGLSAREAITEIKKYLGVQDVETWNQKKEFSIPAIPKKCAKPSSNVLRWLLQDRKISREAIGEYQVAESGNYVVFPFKFGDKNRMCKIRDITNKKNQKPTSAGQEPCLFGWQAIPEDQRVCYITEGELDAMALFDYGYPSLSVPFGGGAGAKQANWIENEYDNLQRFDEIILCLDSDQAGKDAAKEIIDRVGRDRCRIATLPRKDANSCLIDEIEKKEIDFAISSAESLDPDELVSASKFEENVIRMIHPSGHCEPGFFCPWPKAKDQIYFRYSELTVCSGINGHGKSQAVGQFVLSAITQGEKTCIASMEMSPARTLRRLAKQATGLTSGIPTEDYIRSTFKWFDDKVWVYNVIGLTKGERMLEVFNYARKRYGIKVFVIDSLMMCGLGEDDYNAQKKFVSDICDFKNNFGCHVFLVTHSRKGEKEEVAPNKFDVRGSGSITDLADNVLTVWRNKLKEKKLSKDENDSEALDWPDAKIICSKQRHGDWEGNISLWYDRNCYQFLSHRNEKPKQYVEFSNLMFSEAR